MIVNIKYLGKRRNSIEEIPFHLYKNPNTIEELIDETVKVCIEQYKTRQDKRDIFKALSRADIEDRAARGKVSFGLNYGQLVPELEKAIEDARQAFEDGLVSIFRRS